MLARHATNDILKDFMLSLSCSSVLRKSGLCLFAILTLPGEFPCSASTPPPVPTSFQDLYSSLNNYLDSFNTDRKSTRLNSSHLGISYAVFCLKKKTKKKKKKLMRQHCDNTISSTLSASDS